MVTGKIKSAGNFSWKWIKIIGSTLWSWIKFLAIKLKQLILLLISPLIKASKGALFYLKICYEFGAKALRAILESISNVATQVAHWLYIVLKGVLETLWKSIKFVFDYLIKMPLQKTNNVYFFAFEFLLKFFKGFGIVGELIFTVVGLVWLLWPLVVGYCIGRPEFYLPAVVLTIFLILKGRKILVEN